MNAKAINKSTPTLAELLLEQGIHAAHYKVGNQKLLCPRCSANRSKSSDPCLSLTIEDDGDSAVWKCHHCEWASFVNGQNSHSPKRRQAKVAPVRPIRAPDELTPRALEWLTMRGISETVIRRNRIGSTIHYVPGLKAEVECVTFPYYRNGELINIKYRALDEKAFAQVKGAELILYGLDDIVGARDIYIVEGEPDKLACEEAEFRNVVSVPSGSQSKGKTAADSGSFKWIDNCAKYLAPADRFIFAGDHDEKGRALESELLRRLGRERFGKVSWPEGCKDANDVLMAYGRDTLRQCLERVEPYPPISVVDKEDESSFDPQVSLDDFYAYMPTHKYIYAPSGDMWPSNSINSRIPPISEGRGTIKASAWLDNHRPVEKMTWAPGMPEVIKNKLIIKGGWIDKPGNSCFNLYKPPSINGGDPDKAEIWVEHVGFLYPDEAEHLLDWTAHRVQYPGIKVNHSLLLGGDPGIGKDTILEGLKRAVGPWNFIEATPKQVLGRFASFLQCVILRISEAHDARDANGIHGALDFNKHEFYETTKIYMAAPPDVIPVEEKNIPMYWIPNVCGILITTNHRMDSIYLPPDDRRHFVAWSEVPKTDDVVARTQRLWDFYNNHDGFRHVAAYLRTRDISRFDPKADPPKTDAFWAIADGGRNLEEPELNDVLDALKKPPALTIEAIQDGATGGLADWLKDRKNRRAIPHRLESCDYASVRNPDATDGMWSIGGKRRVIYARKELPKGDRLTAVRNLVEGKPNP